MLDFLIKEEIKTEGGQITTSAESKPLMPSSILKTNSSASFRERGLHFQLATINGTIFFNLIVYTTNHTKGKDILEGKYKKRAVIQSFESDEEHGL